LILNFFAFGNNIKEKHLMSFDRPIDAWRGAKSPVLDRGNKVLTAMEVLSVCLYGSWAV